MNGGQDECKYWGNGTSIGAPRCQCKPGFEGEFCQNSKAIRAQISPPRSQKKDLAKSEKSSSVADAEGSGIGVSPAEGQERHPAFPQKLGNPLEKLR